MRLQMGPLNKGANRRGTAVVELAIALPVLATIVFVTIDICSYLHLKQKVNSAAFEAVRVASMPDQTFEGATDVGLEFADARDVVRCVIDLAPEDSDYWTRAEMPVGKRIISRASAPVNGNVPGPFLMFRGQTIQSETFTIAVR